MENNLITDLDEKLKKAKQAFEDANKSEEYLWTLREQQSVLKAKKDEAYINLLNEQKDVDQLTGKMLKSFVTGLLGNKSDLLEQEELEAIEAEQVHDELLTKVKGKKSKCDELLDKINRIVILG